LWYNTETTGLECVKSEANRHNTGSSYVGNIFLPATEYGGISSDVYFLQHCYNYFTVVRNSVWMTTSRAWLANAICVTLHCVTLRGITLWLFAHSFLF